MGEPASIAVLRLEREKLLAYMEEARAKELEQATLSTQAVSRAAVEIVKRMLDALPEYTQALLERAAVVSGETEIHHAMLDETKTWLRSLEHAIREARLEPAEYANGFCSAVRPRDLMTVSQWADRYRMMRSGTNMPGQWRTETTPYLREIMDSLSAHSPVTEIDFIKSVQVGATEVIFNFLGYVMHHLQNKDMLVVVPTKEFRNQKFNPRLNRMLEESPALRELVTFASRSRKHTEDVVEFGAGAKIIKAGANVSTDLRSDPVPYVVCDEVDEFPDEIPGSGDPMTLIEGRQTTFTRPKTLRISTPKLKHTSRIWRYYEASDKRRYYVPCPYCGGMQPLEWGQLKWRTNTYGQESLPEDKRVPQVEAVWYECKHCGKAIDETFKQQMLAAGVWVPERPWVKHHRGYHINALYAPVGLGKGWKWLAQKWLSVQGDTAQLQAFVNERLGEPWEVQGEGVDPIGLLARLEEYPDRRDVRARTAWVDVQKDRLEFTVCEWGPGEECWVIDHVILPGDTARDEVWAELEEAFAGLSLDAAGVDAGYHTSQVKAFVANKRWCFATKGVSGPGRPIVEDQATRSRRLRQRMKKGYVPVEPIGVDNAKALIYARLKIEKPGPGFIHFPRLPAFDDEYFAQLTAEKLVTKYRGARPVQEWVLMRSRNEALDCLVGNLAVLRLGVPAKRMDMKEDGPATLKLPSSWKKERGDGPPGNAHR